MAAVAEGTSRRARQAEHSRPVELAARLGIAAQGVVYLVIGVLAVQVAIGRTDQRTDRDGALRQIADKPFGTALLIVLVVGFAGYAVWSALEAAVGHRDATDARTRTGRRLLSAGRAAVYAAFAVSTALFLASDGHEGGGGGNPAPWSARLMRHAGGRWLVGIAGAVVIAVGVVLAVQALRARFMKDLRTARMSARTRRAVQTLGRVGQTARAVVVALVGVFLLEAAIAFDPKQARGLDGALKSLAGHAYGQWLLGATALGLLAYGLYAFAEARFRKV